MTSTTDTSARYASPLRYPGGKGKVANFMKLLIHENSLHGANYVEPYAGGASVALSLLLENYVENIHINDLNRGVYAFWRYLVEDAESLCSRIARARLSIDEWQRQKNVHANPESPLDELGFATFFLNRTNRSGIISRGGVIGGNEQLGKWKMDARFDRARLCSRVRTIAKHKDRIKVTREDAASLLAHTDYQDANTLLYLDPPYFVKGSGLYDNFYGYEDHRNVADLVKTVKCRWVVSYDAAPEILELYDDCQALRYTLGYSASNVSNGTEVMFFSSGLQLPAVRSPAGITRSQLKRALGTNARSSRATEGEDP